MAFGWDTVSSGINLYRSFKGSKESKAEKGSRRSAEAARQYAAWAADPTSPGFKNLAALFEEADRRRAVEASQRVMRQSARAKARGDVGFGINPERRDEARYEALINAFMNAKERSRQEARNALIQAGQVATGAAGAYPVGAGYDRSMGDWTATTGGIEAIPSFMQAFSANVPSKPRSNNPTIVWNPRPGEQHP